MNTDCHCLGLVAHGNYQKCPVLAETDDLIDQRKDYKLKHFMMSAVDAPSNTPVIFVDHGIRLKGKNSISLAKITDLEALLVSEKNMLLTAIEGELPEEYDLAKSRNYFQEKMFNDALDHVKQIISQHKKK